MSDDHEEIHRSNTNPVGTGTNPLSVAVASNEAATKDKINTPTGSSLIDTVVVPKMSSFEVYWDVAKKEWKVFEPKVVLPGGQEITAEQIAIGNDGICSCAVHLSDGSYSAELKEDWLIDRTDPTLVLAVRLFKMQGGDVVEQYHTGTIVVGGGTGAGDIPWQFSCQTDPDTGVRSGGWSNAILQIAYQLHGPFSYSAGRDDHNLAITDDGEHYIEFDATTNHWQMKVAQDTPQTDPANGLIRIRIGEVSNGKLILCVHAVPVIYLYV